MRAALVIADEVVPEDTAGSAAIAGHLRGRVHGAAVKAGIADSVTVIILPARIPRAYGLRQALAPVRMTVLGLGGAAGLRPAVRHYSQA